MCILFHWLENEGKKDFPYDKDEIYHKELQGLSGKRVEIERTVGINGIIIKESSYCLGAGVLQDNEHIDINVLLGDDLFNME